MAVELGGRWKLLISFNTQLEQTAQRSALERRFPSLLSSPRGEAWKERGPFPEETSGKAVPAFSSITLTIPPAIQPSLFETWSWGQRGLVQ